MKTKRNSLCPCGSLIKFKRCCGSEAKLTAKRNAEHEEFVAQVKARIEEKEKGIAYNRPVRPMLAAAMLLACTMPLGGNKL